MPSPRRSLLPAASPRRQVDALDEKAVEEHLSTVVERAGRVDISLNAIGPGRAPHRVALTELTADAFSSPIAFQENFATAAQAAGVTPAEFQAILEQGTLLKRLPTLAEVADTAAFIASDRAGAMTATVANVSAGSITD
jgi:NAD(P)-dependent dehydrogenase (short-subunit alcohol dehydrogenase family)